MRNLKKEGHKLLIFSMSKMILDLLQSMILAFNQYSKHKLNFSRIDGDTKPEAREQI